MTEQTNLVPKRRFKEFQNTYAWEQRKLGEIGEFKNGMNFGKEAMGHGHPFVNLQDIFGKNVVDDSNLGLAESSENQRKEYCLNKGDVLFIRSSVKPEGVGETALVPRDFPDTTYSGFIIRFRPNVQIADEFKRFAFSTKHIRNQIMASATSSANTNINQESLQKIELKLPDNEEQEKVGAFFANLDHLITLHQRKLEKSKALKSAYLSEMFPADGGLVPKRRFAGFTDAWEQRKFKDMLDQSDGIRRGPFGSALKKEFFVHGSDYVVYEQQNAIYDKYETRYNITKEKYDELHRFKVNAGDFIMSGGGTIGRISRVPEGIKQGVFNQALIRMKINPDITDSEFFLQWMRSDDMQRKLTGANPASAMVNLVPMSEVKEWGVIVPGIEEQSQIGSFFSTLDNLITLHQRKLEKLINIKKAYLNEMFV